MLERIDCEWLAPGQLPTTTFRECACDILAGRQPIHDFLIGIPCRTFARDEWELLDGLLDQLVLDDVPGQPLVDGVLDQPVLDDVPG